MNVNVFNVPMFDGTQREVALVWRLAKRKRYAECRLWTHPLKAEIRVEAAGEFVRSRAGADVLALIEIAETWKAQFQEKGLGEPMKTCPYCGEESQDAAIVCRDCGRDLSFLTEDPASKEAAPPPAKGAWSGELPSKRRKRFAEGVFVRTADGMEIDFDELQRFYVEQVREMCENAIAHWHETAASLQRALAANQRGEPLLNAVMAAGRAQRSLESLIPFFRDNLKCLDQLRDIAMTRPPDVRDRVDRLVGELTRHV